MKMAKKPIKGIAPGSGTGGMETENGFIEGHGLPI